MAARVIELRHESKRRMEKFHRRCAEAARSRTQYMRTFLEDVDHIVVRAGQQNSSLRTAIDRERIAALIIQGRLNFGLSNDRGKTEIAVEGVFRNFKYVEYGSTSTTSEIMLDRLQVRVVIRDGIKKILIVTVYPIETHTDETLPEVQHEIW